MAVKHHRIIEVLPQSLGEDAGIGPEDRLAAINGAGITDILDYLEWMASDSLLLEVIKPYGEIWEIEIEKEPGEDLGLVFEQPLLDKQRGCANQCIFCFVDQLPPNMRGSLQVKDDDWRLSFLMGNYITLTNLSEKDIRRIIKKRLGPLYVSVHTTNPALRDRMLGSKRGGQTLSYLEAFARAKLPIHCQIVLCPGYNDGSELTRTMQDLYRMRSSIQSVSVVPVGLTGYREGLPPVRPCSQEEAAAVIEQVEAHQAEFLADGGSAFVYLADELYLKAEKPFPPFEAYEDFPQLDNGVGMCVLFLSELRKAMDERPDTRSPYRKVTLVTGVSAYPVLRGILQEMGMQYRCTLQLVPVSNTFFGGAVTVAGLLTGRDILSGLSGLDLGEKVLLPLGMLRKGAEVFLDDMTVTELQSALKVPLETIPARGAALLDAILGPSITQDEVRIW